MAESKNNGDIGSASRISYPARPFTNTLELVKLIVQHGGGIAAMPLKDISVATGISVPALQYPLQSAVEYNLLDKRSEGYIATDDFQKIDAWPEDKNLQLAALKRPPIFSKLIDDLNGKTLPSKEWLVRYIVKEFKMLENSAERVIVTFLKNAEQFGLIDNGRLRFFIPPTAKTKDTPKSEEVLQDEKDLPVKEVASTIKKKVFENKSDELFELPIPLTGNQIAYLFYPKDKINKRDIGVIKLQLAVIEATLGSGAEKIEGE